LPLPSKTTLEPRKMPVQARSAVTVAAVLEATVQVLLEVGKEQLTTTRVAYRAGVSVGTLYQYFPNKSALLQAALKRHLEIVMDAVEDVCRQQRGNTLTQMATALVHAFLEAKMKNVKTSTALYFASSDLDGVKLARRNAVRMNQAIVAMLETSREELSTDAELVASMVQGAMAGVSRRLLESGAPEKHLGSVRHELASLICSYLEACARHGASNSRLVHKPKTSADVPFEYLETGHAS
jgi:AcrR family transcriptional regulator